MDLENARYNMIEQQIRPWDVLDQNVLELMNDVKREQFVPEGAKTLAFVDMGIPLPGGEKMWQPKMEARVVQDLSIKPSDRILEIGTGSGYLTALLAKRGQHVYSVEINPELKALAERNLQRAGIRNVTLELGDGANGWPNHGPYDVIVLSGSVPLLPEAFKEQLNVDGRMFAIVGDAPVMNASLIVRAAPDAFTQVVLFETVIPALKNAQQPQRFVF